MICHSLIHFGDGYIYRKEEEKEKILSKTSPGKKVSD